MTRRMRDVLEDAVRQELRRVDGRWPAHASTLAALVRRGLLERSERLSRHGDALTAWTVTEAGREALRPRERFKREPNLYTSRIVVAGKRGSYTPLKHQASDSLPTMDPEAIGRWWFEQAEHRRIEAENARERARRAASRMRRAA